LNVSLNALEITVASLLTFIPVAPVPNDSSVSSIAKHDK